MSDLRMVTSTNPATGQPLGDRIDHAESAVEEALSELDHTQRTWALVPPERRGELLQHVARAIDREADALAAGIVAEMGKPLRQARGEVAKCAGLLRYYAEQAAALVATRSVATEARRSEVRVQPLGVILGIMPWNFPLWQIVRWAVPALVTGNTCLVKPADNTAGSCEHLVRLFDEAAASLGDEHCSRVLASVSVSNERAGDLIDDDRIAGVSLTGSGRAGRSVAARAGAALKPSVLELGGSDAAVVLPGVDFDRVLPKLVQARFQNTGQTCVAAKRYLLHADIADEFRERFVEAVLALQVGDPTEETTDVGPLARGDLRESLHEQVERTVVEGARLLIGGQPLALPGDLAGGFFYEPTVLDQVTEEMTPFREELFGPAASLVEARDNAELLRLANATPYGLSATVWTDDRERADDFVQHLHAGAVFVNELAKSDWRLPFGGIKASGYGRELGGYGIAEFANLKTVWVD